MNSCIRLKILNDFDIQILMSYQYKKSSILYELEQAIKRKVVEKPKPKEQCQRNLQASLDKKKNQRQSVDRLSKVKDAKIGGNAFRAEKGASLFNNENLLNVASSENSRSGMEPKKLNHRKLDKLISLINYALSSAEKTMRYINTSNFEAQFAVKLFRSDKENLQNQIKNLSLEDIIDSMRDGPKVHTPSLIMLQEENLKLKKELTILQKQHERSMRRMAPSEAEILLTYKEIEIEKFKETLYRLRGQEFSDKIAAIIEKQMNCEAQYRGSGHSESNEYESIVRSLASERNSLCRDLADPKETKRANNQLIEIKNFIESKIKNDGQFSDEKPLSVIKRLFAQCEHEGNQQRSRKTTVEEQKINHIRQEKRELMIEIEECKKKIGEIHTVTEMKSEIEAVRAQVKKITRQVYHLLPQKLRQNLPSEPEDYREVLKSLSEVMDDYLELQVEFQNLVQKIQESEHELTVLKSQIAETSQLIRELKSKIRIAEEEARVKNEELEQKAQQIARLQDNLHASERKVKDMFASKESNFEIIEEVSEYCSPERSHRNPIHDQEMEVLEEKIREYEKNGMRQDQQLQQMEIILKNKVQEVNELEIELSKLTNEHTVLNNNYQQLQDKNKKVISDLVAAEKELADLKKENKENVGVIIEYESELEDRDSRISQLLATIEQKDTEIQEMTSKIQQLNENIRSLEIQLQPESPVKQSVVDSSKLDEVLRRQEQLSARNLQLDAKETEISQKFEKIAEQFSTKQVDLEQKQAKLSEWVQQLTVKEQQLEDKEQKLALIEEKLQEAEERIINQEAQLNSLKEQQEAAMNEKLKQGQQILSSKSLEIEEKEKKASQKLQQIQQKDMSLQNSAESLANRQKIISCKESELAEQQCLLEDERKALEIRKIELNEEVEKVEAELSLKSEEANKKQNEISKKFNYIVEREQKLASKIELVSQQEAQASERLRSLADREQKLLHKEEQINEQNSKVLQLQEQLTDKLAQIQNKLKQAQKQTNDYEIRHNALLESQAQLQQQRKQLDDQMAKFEEQKLSKLSGEEENKYLAGEQELAKAKARIEQLQMQLQEKDDQLLESTKGWNDKIEALMKQLTEFQRREQEKEQSENNEVARLKDLYQAVVGQKVSLTEQKYKCEQKIEEINSILVSSQHSIKQLESIIQKLESELATHSTKNEQLEDLIIGLKMEIKLKGEENYELLESVEQLNVKLSDVQSNFEVFERENKELIDKLEKQVRSHQQSKQARDDTDSAEEIESLQNKLLKSEENVRELNKWKNISCMKQKQYCNLIKRILRGCIDLDELGDTETMSLGSLLEIGTQKVMQQRIRVREEESNQKKQKALGDNGGFQLHEDIGTPSPKTQNVNEFNVPSSTSIKEHVIDEMDTEQNHIGYSPVSRLNKQQSPIANQPQQNVGEQVEESDNIQLQPIQKSDADSDKAVSDKKLEGNDKQLNQFEDFRSEANSSMISEQNIEGLLEEDRPQHQTPILNTLLQEKQETKTANQEQEPHEQVSTMEKQPKCQDEHVGLIDLPVHQNEQNQLEDFNDYQSEAGNESMISEGAFNAEPVIQTDNACNFSEFGSNVDDQAMSSSMIQKPEDAQEVQMQPNTCENTLQQSCEKQVPPIKQEAFEDNQEAQFEDQKPKDESYSIKINNIVSVDPQQPKNSATEDPSFSAFDEFENDVDLSSIQHQEHHEDGDEKKNASIQLENFLDFHETSVNSSMISNQDPHFSKQPQAKQQEGNDFDDFGDVASEKLNESMISNQEPPSATEIPQDTQPKETEGEEILQNSFGNFNDYESEKMNDSMLSANQERELPGGHTRGLKTPERRNKGEEEGRVGERVEEADFDAFEEMGSERLDDSMVSEKET